MVGGRQLQEQGEEGVRGDEIGVGQGKGEDRMVRMKRKRNEKGKGGREEGE